MHNITDAFIDYICHVNQSLSLNNIEWKAKQVLLDYLGVVYAGAYVGNRTLEPYYKTSSGFSSILGVSDMKADARVAAFVNGFHAHELELDDGSRFGMLHLGAVVLSALLALAEQEKSPFDSIMRGIICGYEAAVRLAVSIQPGHKKRGYHTTGTCGSIGAALGCAIMLNMDSCQMKSVLSAAATSAAGMLVIQENASELKAYNIGHAAMTAVAATMMGQCGLCGPDDILGGDRGFLTLHSDTVDMDKLVKITDCYEIERIYVKPYAACRHCHSAIEAVLKIRRDWNVPIELVNKICIDTYRMAIRGHDHSKIQGIQSAKLSMPYSVAAAYALGSCTMDAFTEENISNRKILDLTGKVHVRENPKYTALESERRIAEVTVITVDGREASCRIDFAKGDPEHPLSEEELNIKFMDLMNWCGMKEKAVEITKVLSQSNINNEELFAIL